MKRDRPTKLLEKRESRRNFLKKSAAGVAASLVSGCSQENHFFEDFFKRHYKELSASDKERIFRRIEEKAERDIGVRPTIQDPQPIPGVKFVYTLSLSLCNGNRRCVEACVRENNQDRSTPIEYIRVLEMPIGSMNLESGSSRYEGEVPKDGKFYLPMQCFQCDNPPCVKVCPIEATWKEQDGIVAIDYDWCIGCRYCMAACPYEARRFNFSAPKISPEEVNPNQGYLSNRLRPAGVVEKCHFCMHRTRVGKNPACMEACPTGARNFGNILDPSSEVFQILKYKLVFVLKEELNTIPSFYYYLD